jgi:fumarylacetoacetate (FAA) hydrolase family protein
MMREGAIMGGFLPDDAEHAVLIGRMDFGAGPSPVAVVDGRILDVSAHAPTVSQYLNLLTPGERPSGIDRGALSDLAPRAVWDGGSGCLSPIDLQCIKAAGVTFARSTLERVIEEAARGDKSRAASIRNDLAARIGGELGAVRPGSPEAVRLKAELIAAGLWSQYLEVAIGPDAEIFTKAPVLSSVGWGALVGVRSDSAWNNPEPEAVLVCDGQGRARGAMLGNDVNLRDFEGRSALLLAKAKDNTASCALGPFIRLFDDRFTLEDVRSAIIGLEVSGEDGFTLSETSEMAQISRDPLELISQACGPNHQYPDGFVLFCGTMFAPVQDRDGAGAGFTHHVGDIVRIRSPRLGVLENKVVACEDAPPWTFGIGALMESLAARGRSREI